MGAKSSGSKGTTYREFFPKSTVDNRRRLIFTKSRIMKSYAYTTEIIKQKKDQSSDPEVTSIYVTTPLAIVPVNFTPFYLSPSEFESLPLGSKVTKVKCQIKPLGVKIAFDYGTTLTGTAATEYVAIGMASIGLNKKVSSYHGSYKTDATKPMVPKDTEPEYDFKERFYGIQGTIMCIPRHISQYFLICMINENFGGFGLDKFVRKFLINSMIGQVVLDYEYTPRMGQIGQQHNVNMPQQFKALKKPINENPREFVNVMGTVNPPFSILEATSQDDYLVGFNKQHTGSAKDETQWSTFNTSNYQQSIEKYGAFHPSGSNRSSLEVQPLAYIGIQAIPSLNPSKKSQDYVNACAYWEINCMIEIEVNISDSAFAFKNNIGYSDQLNLFPIRNVMGAQFEDLFNNVYTMAQYNNTNVNQDNESETSNVEMDTFVDLKHFN